MKKERPPGKWMKEKFCQQINKSCEGVDLIHRVHQDCLSNNYALLLFLTEGNAQVARSYFEHILLCTTSVAYGHWASLVSVSGTYGA